MRTSNEVIISAGAMGSSINSTPILLNQVYCFMIQAVVTSASGLTGTLKLQLSADPNVNPNTNTITNWTDYPSSSQAVTGNDTFVWDVTVTGGNWVRLVWTNSGGTGTLNAKMNTKGV